MNLKDFHIDPRNTLDEIVITWSYEDVHAMIEDRELTPVDDDTARLILHWAHDLHDCNYGFTWDLLEDAYNSVMETRK